ncbi:MAG: DUF4382 domain-containing protein [Gammaproteobacteria bacterium]|nr:DUF4382 domain-containing protein [Gammaproteobacteria bacterium]
MIQFIQRIAVFFLGAGLVLSLVSCGGGNGDSIDTSIQGKGTVGILLTDMPADPALFDSINASIVKVELLDSDDNGRVTLYSGAPQVFDLLRLRNEAIPLAFKDDVPAGKYCKIRLILSDLELVLADDGSSYHPNLPGNGKLDLLARDCFNVMADEVLTLQLDIDAGKSIHVVGNNNGYKFRPVIFVDVVDQSFDSKLVRLTGEIAKINTGQRSLLLCDAIPSENMDNQGCVKVHFGDDAAFFDNQQHSGAPRSIDDELLSFEKLGLEITVVGWPRFWDDSDIDEDKNSEHYPLMQLDALVAELGGFLQVEGTVSVDSDSNQFSMTVSSGSPIITSDALTVVFQQTMGDVNGTRVVSKSGELLDPLDVKIPLPVQVDGVLLLSNAELNAALVIVDKSALGTEQITGIISSVEVNSLTLDLEEAVSVCGEPPTSQLVVGLAASLDILTVTITEGGSVISFGGSPAIGQSVGMNGSCEPDGYETDNLVIIDDLRV